MNIIKSVIFILTFSLVTLAFADQIPVEDRWAIVAYFKALQRSRKATAKDIPQDVLKDMR